MVSWCSEVGCWKQVSGRLWSLQDALPQGNAISITVAPCRPLLSPIQCSPLLDRTTSPSHDKSPGTTLRQSCSGSARMADSVIVKTWLYKGTALAPLVVLNLIINLALSPHFALAVSLFDTLLSTSWPRFAMSPRTPSSEEHSRQPSNPGPTSSDGNNESP